MLSCSCRFIVEMAVNGGEAAGLRQVAAMYEQLKAEWNKKSPSLSKCGDVLGKLKVRSGEAVRGQRPRGTGAESDVGEGLTAWVYRYESCQGVSGYDDPRFPRSELHMTGISVNSGFVVIPVPGSYVARTVGPHSCKFQCHVPFE